MYECVLKRLIVETDSDYINRTVAVYYRIIE
jgi:hypothetical protein